MPVVLAVNSIPNFSHRELSGMHTTRAKTPLEKMKTVIAVRDADVSVLWNPDK
jgi:hypothetical protein